VPDPDLLTIPEVAQLLRVGRGTVTRWVANGVLCSVRLGRQRRVTRAQLDDFLVRLERDGHVPPAWPHTKGRASPGSTRRVDR
jgi:excisionase family DNA binding protein